MTFLLCCVCEYTEECVKCTGIHPAHKIKSILCKLHIPTYEVHWFKRRDLCTFSNLIEISCQDVHLAFTHQFFLPPARYKLTLPFLPTGMKFLTGCHLAMLIVGPVRNSTFAVCSTESRNKTINFVRGHTGWNE